MEHQNLFKKIVVPLDGSHWAERAIPHAEQIARNAGSELILVHVYHPKGAEYSGNVALAGHTDHTTQARQAAEMYVKGLLGKIASQKVNCRTHIIEGSNVAGLICDFVNSEEADLVVMPTAGQNRLMRMFLGDLSSKVRGCINACLLLVRGDMEAEWDESSRKALERQAATAPTTTPPAELIAKLTSLRDAGILTDDEFEAKRALVAKQT
jgi:nucleotide-binding universal stress UspA family protein